MSKKKLLEEAQVRRMFQLAGIPAIGESFIGDKFSRFVEEEEKEEEKDEVEEGKYKREDEDDKEEVEESFAALGEEDEDPMGEEPAEDPMGEEPAEDPMGDAPEAGGDIPQDKVEAIVDAVLAGIEKETGVPLERVPDAEGGMEPEAGGEEEIAAADGEEEEPVEDLSLIHI